MKKWKRALVTGAATGLGRALTLELLKNGTEVFALDVNEIEYENRDKLLKKIGINLINLKQIKSCFFHLDQSQKFDLVIHNAGISATGKFENIPTEAYEKLVKLNLEAPIHINTQLCDQNLFTEKAEVIFISSLSYATGYPGASVYAASKEAIAIYAKSIRRPFAKVGIAVMTVFPGPIRTDHAERHAPEGANAEKRSSPDKVAKQILQAATKGRRSLYPGMTAKTSWLLGQLAPGSMTRLMRKLIYDKLKTNKPTW